MRYNLSSSPEYQRNRIKELLRKRLQKLGSIKTADAYELCKEEFAYDVVAKNFRTIMSDLKNESKADFIRNGVWWIRSNKVTDIFHHQ